MNLIDEIPQVCCVYKITNTINNLSIIGSTKNLNRRINHYRNDIKKDNPLKHYNKRFLQDIMIYGLISFEVEILEEYNSSISDIELKNNETNYILKYNTNNPEIGYNLRLDIDGKYICNDSTRILKSKQLKQQWSNGIRSNHSNKMKDYWKNNQDRKQHQSKVMSKALTKYVYNIYLDDKLIKKHILYSEIEKCNLDISFGMVRKYFSDADKELNKDNNTMFKKLAKVVYYKKYKIERILAVVLKI